MRVASNFILLCISVIILLGSTLGYGLSDVHNTYDFLAPVIGWLQFISVVGLFKGKLWGLIGYTVVCLGTLITLLVYLFSKEQLGQGLIPTGFLVLLLLLAVYYWTKEREFFK
jgi:hypothetical protein